MSTQLRPPMAARPNPSARTRSAIIDRLSPEDIGMFWDQIATSLPLIEETGAGDEVIVTFCWRDDEAEAVLLFANRLSDERHLDDTMLERKAGTDLWHASFLMKGDWRASYAFLCKHPGEPAPWESEGQVELRAVLHRGYLDPLNPDWCHNRQGIKQSVVSLPDAPLQPWLHRRDDVVPGAVTLEVGPDGRDVWLYDPAGAGLNVDLPLVVALDGEIWTGHHSLPTTLDNLIADGHLRHVRCVMPASGGRDKRWEELAGGEGADYIVDQLLPWVRERRAVSEETYLVGQSLGGVTALRAGLTYPEHIHGVASQSASLWLDDLADAVTPDAKTRVHLAHGTQEWVLDELHHDLVDRLRAAGIDVTSAEHNGGHDYAWWRSAVADGLRALLPPT